MLYLASSSPRRQELLKWLEIPFQVVDPDFNESAFKEKFASQLEPKELSANLAYEKALSATKQLSTGVVLAADTEVYLEGQSLGKPTNLQAAREMINRLSGRQHLVITGVCLMEVETGLHRIEIEESIVEFFDLSKEVIESYLKSAGKKILDKAGAYAIQMKESKNLIADYQGSLTNIIGLPLVKTVDLLEEFGVMVNKDVKKLVYQKLGKEEG